MRYVSKSKMESKYLPTKPNRVVLSWTPYDHNYHQYYAYDTIQVFQLPTYYMSY